MTRLWIRKVTLLKLGVVLALMGVLGVVVMDTRPASAATMATVSAGVLHTCAVTDTGGVKCWGFNNSGQLGDGTTTSRNVPVDVSGLASGIAAVSAGGSHTCALTTTGGVKCWGRNFTGQLGDGTTTPNTSNVPVDVSGLSSGVTAISAGESHTCALTTAGGLKCWGRNFSGQLGDGTNTDSNIPVDVSGLTSGMTAVSAGDRHTCAVTTTGGIKCWGSNFFGSLGDGTGTDSNIPVDVTGLASGTTAVSAGQNYTCAVTATEGIKCWGDNLRGQLGDGTTTSRNVPVDVSGLASGMDTVSARVWHTCALTVTGGVKCWGFNLDGRLGDGTTSTSTVPVDVSDLASGVTIVSVGGAHTCVLTATGGINCWGTNFDGQLGAGDLAESDTPVAIHIPFTLEDHDARIMAALDGLSIGGGGDTSAALAAIQAKLDADLDAAVTTRSSQSSVDALDTAVTTRSSQSSVDALDTALSNKSSQTSVDALSIRMDELEAKLDEILGLLSTPGSSPGGGPPGGGPPGGGP